MMNEKELLQAMYESMQEIKGDIREMKGDISELPSAEGAAAGTPDGGRGNGFAAGNHRFGADES